MQICSAREFRSNQGKYLVAARRGQSILLTSRYGNFKITPVSEEDNITQGIVEGLKEVKKMIKGEIPTMSAKQFLDEL